MNFVKLSLIASLLLAATSSVAQGYNSYQKTLFTSTGTGALLYQRSLMHYHQISWVKTGTVTSCTVVVDSSADNITFGNGDLISGQNCSTNGTSAGVNNQNEYVRVRVTSFVGTGSIIVTYKGWIVSPSGAGGGGGSGGTIGGSAAVGSLPKMVTDTVTLGTSLYTDNGTLGTYSGASGFTALSFTTAGIMSAATFAGTGIGGMNIGCNQSSIPGTPGANKDGIFCATDAIYMSFNNDSWKKVLRQGTVDVSDIVTGLFGTNRVDTSSTGTGLGTALVSQSDVPQCTGFTDYLGGTSWNCAGFLTANFTGDYTAQSTDIQNMMKFLITVDSTVSLPSPTAPFNPPSLFFIKNSPDSSAKLTIKPLGGLTINGVGSTVLNPDAWAIVFAAPDASHWEALISSANGEFLIQ